MAVGRFRGDAAVFVAIGFVDSLGSAALIAAGVLIYTRLLDLSATVVGSALTAAGLVAVVLVLPVTQWVGRFSSRRAMVALNATMALLTLVLLVPAGGVYLAVVLALLALGNRCISAVRAAALGRLGEQRIAIRARVRSAQNLGLALGGLAAAAAVGTGGTAALVWLLIADAVTYIVCSFMALRVDGARSARGPAMHPLAIIRDHRFLLASAVNTVAGLHNSLLFVALPLWITHVVHAPAVLVPISAVLNTVLVVLLQRRLSIGLDAVSDALRAQAASGAILLGACVLAAASLATSGPLQAAVLLAASTAFTLTEIRQSAAAWGISYGLSPADNLTQYQGLFGLSSSAEDVIGPLLITLLILPLPAGLGWILIGTLVLITTAAAHFTRHTWARSPTRDALLPH